MTHDQTEFVCENDLSETEITAGLAAGTLTFFRVDAAGRDWYRCTSPQMIRGVPSAEKIIRGVTPQDEFLD